MVHSLGATMTTFNQWLDTFIDEKGINRDEIIEAEGLANEEKAMPLEAVITAIKSTSDSEQRRIHKILVLIDWRNDDVMPFFRTLACALAQ